MNPLILLPSLVLLLATMSFGLGTQRIGNEPFNGANYADWPGILPVVNHPTRELQLWVNGNESFHYKAKVADINAMLTAFAKVKRDRLEVLMRPGKASAKTLRQDQAFETNVELRLIGGIAAGMAREDKGTVFWNTTPRLTIYTDGLDLDQLVFPKGLKLMQLDELGKLYRDALDSRSQTVRGWGAGMLAELDPHNLENMRRIGTLLKDQENWVVNGAARSLVTYGKLATEFLPQLETLSMDDDKKVVERVTDAMNAIKAAPDLSDEAKTHREQLKAIRERLAAP